MGILQQPKGLSHRTRATPSVVGRKTFPCPEGALQIDGCACGAVRLLLAHMDWRERALIAARSLVRNSCQKVFGMPFQGADAVGVHTEGVALVYYGAARWAAQPTPPEARTCNPCPGAVPGEGAVPM